MQDLRICVRGLHTVNDRIYLIKEDTRQNTDGWFLPGGEVDIGEDFSTALRREISEEIGVNFDDIKVNETYIGHYTFLLNNGQLNINLVLRVEFPIPDSLDNQGEDKVINQKLVQKNKISNYLPDSISNEFESDIIPNIF